MDGQSNCRGLRGVVRNRLGTIWVRILALSILLATCGCDTKHVGLGDVPIRGPIVTVTVPAGMFGWEKANWVVSWTGGTAPYTLSWDMGGGAHQNTIVIQDAVSPQSQEFCMVDDSGASPVFTYTATLTDSTGQVGSSSGLYTLGSARNMQPNIDQMTFEDGILTVFASDMEGDQVSVHVNPSHHFTIDHESKDAEPLDGLVPGPCKGFEGVATFHLTLDNDYMFTGGSEMLGVTVEDGNGGSGTDSILITIDPIPIEPDTLYAFPMVESAAVGDPVRILIYTGETAQPFLFMLGVGVVLDDDAQYVSKTFNVGAVGGETDDADGVWADITSDGGFILGPDALIKPGVDPSGSLEGKKRFDFNISPLGGTDQNSVEGELFNFQVTYSRAGLKRIGLQEFNGVNRTYYNSKAAGIETHSWSVLMADETGNLHPSVVGQVNNTVLVQ